MPSPSPNAIVTIVPGAGGIDASDWASMLLRMYAKWCSRMEYEVAVLDYHVADGSTILVKGPHAYGRLQAEQGVHRLVRISPFDGKARRMTSLASVEVVPELDDNISVPISWGNHIRSYVMQPYQMVKDLRTDVETSAVDRVLDGDIDQFIEAWLKQHKDK